MTSAVSATTSTVAESRRSWLFAPMPLGRVAVLRTLVYVFVFVDVWRWSDLVRSKGGLDLAFYQPLRIARLLPFIPEPTHLVVEACYWGLLILAPLAATSRLPRTIGTAVFLLYGQWMLIAMSYGKVDHDRFALLVALALLPTVGRARHGDRDESPAAGWAIRTTQMAVIATYFLAAWAKIRFGGLGWVTSGTLAWAILRRGTVYSNWLLDHPAILQISQFGIMAFEALSPLVFVVSERIRRLTIIGFYGFHLVTVMSLGISFAPHLVAMLSFFPLERLDPIRRLSTAVDRIRRAAPSAVEIPLGVGERALGGAAGHAVTVAGDPAVEGPADPLERTQAEESPHDTP